jgi:hypothetical protein
LETALLDNHWKVLLDTEAEEVKEQERTDGKWMGNEWTCGHCSVYMSNLQHRSEIIQHLNEEYVSVSVDLNDFLTFIFRHEIVDPKEPEDLFLFERYTKPFHRSIYYPAPDYTAPFYLDNFDAASFPPSEDFNFERDFGQWFNPDDVV